jgi:predicted small lipoprotein YifL
MHSTLRSLALLALASAPLLSGCGGKQKGPEFVVTPAAAVAVDVDADPAALLPFGSVLAANLDAKAIIGSTAGGDLAALAERVLPFAAQIDFQAKRDVDRAWIGMYSFAGADVLAVLSGSFHPEKIAQLSGRSTPNGVLVVSTYAGRTLVTVANVGFTVLSPKTALVGSETAIRRALDRIAAGTVKRELPQWMADWTAQTGYPVLVASDVTKQSAPKTIVQYVPALAGMQYVRLRGRFNPDGSMGLSGALTFPDAGRAAQSAQGLAALPKSLVAFAALKYLGIDPLVRNMTVAPAGNDVQITTTLDEKTARTLLGLLSNAMSGSLPSIPAPSAAPAASGTPM